VQILTTSERVKLHNGNTIRTDIMHQTAQLAAVTTVKDRAPNEDDGWTVTMDRQTPVSETLLCRHTDKLLSLEDQADTCGPIESTSR